MDDTPQNPDRLLTEIEAADLLALTPRALQAWRQREKGPAFVKAGSSVRYRRAAIEAWLDGRTVRNAANPRRSENAFPPKLVAYLGSSQNVSQNVR